MVFSIVVPAAAFEAGDPAFHRLDTRESSATFATGVEKFSFEADALEREIVTPGFVGDAKIAASLTPLETMRSDRAAAGAELGKKVGEFVPQRSLHFGRRDFDELGVKRDCLGAPAGESGCGPEPGIPLDGHLELRASGRAEEMPAELF
jgi:hypothetical protein